MRAQNLVRVVARLLTGYTYGTLGADTFRNPAPRVRTAAPTLAAIRRRVPLPEDDEMLVRTSGAVQSAAGGLLALGVAPRLMSVVLFGTLVPTTFAGHAFWETDDPAERASRKIQFRKNMGLLGGLLFCALDRGSKGARDREGQK